MPGSTSFKLYLNSGARNEGTHENALFHLPPGMLSCRDDQEIQLKVISFVCRNDFYSVQKYNNTFLLNGVAVQIPSGYYASLTMTDALTALLPPDITVTYKELTNGFQFQSPTAFSITFPSASQPSAYTLLGFEAGKTYSGTTIQSPKCAFLNGEEAFYLSLEGVSFKPPAISNFSGSFAPSQIFLTVPLLAPPFGMISYSESGNDNFAFRLLDKDVLRIRLKITNEDGQLIELQSPWTLVLQVDVFPKGQAMDPQEALLREIRDMSKLQTLHLALGEKKI
jgi:hypothetical protein